MSDDTDTPLAPLSRLTAEQWAEQDARVRRELAQEAAQARCEQWQVTRTALLEQGLSARHVDELVDPARVTLDTPALVALPGQRVGISVLAGNVGSGKTYAAHCWLLQSWQDDPATWTPHGLRMVTAPAFARGQRYGEDKFTALAKAKRLVVDDMGTEYADPNGSFLVDFEELVDLRWRAKLPMLIITNLDKIDFKERYGERIADRIRSEGRWISCKRESLRGVGR